MGMTAQEAVSIIDQVCSQINTNREGHAKITEALNTLKELVKNITWTLLNV